MLSRGRHPGHGEWGGFSMTQMPTSMWGLVTGRHHRGSDTPGKYRHSGHVRPGQRLLGEPLAVACGRRQPLQLEYGRRAQFWCVARDFSDEAVEVPLCDSGDAVGAYEESDDEAPGGEHGNQGREQKAA